MTAKKKKNKIIDLFAKFLKGATRGKKMSLEEVTQAMSKSVDKLIMKIEEEENAKFGSGRFYITEVDSIEFKTSVVLYFMKPNEPYYEIRREGKVLTMSRLTVEAISTLRKNHEIAYKIIAPKAA